jgi:hypothetical protein
MRMTAATATRITGTPATPTIRIAVTRTDVGCISSSHEMRPPRFAGADRVDALERGGGQTSASRPRPNPQLKTLPNRDAAEAICSENEMTSRPFEDASEWHVEAQWIGRRIERFLPFFRGPPLGLDRIQLLLWASRALHGALWIACTTGPDAETFAVSRVATGTKWRSLLWRELPIACPSAFLSVQNM